MFSHDTNVNHFFAFRKSRNEENVKSITENYHFLKIKKLLRIYLAASKKLGEGTYIQADTIPPIIAQQIIQ